MNEKLILLKFIAKAQGLSEEQVAGLLYQTPEGEDNPVLKENALQELLDLDKKRVVELKKSVDTTKFFQQGYDKARGEVLSKEERKIAEKFGIEESLKLGDLVDAVVKKQTETLTKDSELTDDKVKIHPIYLALEKAKKEELTKLSETHKTEIETLNSQFQNTQIWNETSGKILNYFNSLNPVLPKNAKLAQNQRNDFIEKFKDYEFQIVEGQKDPVVLKGGKRIEDSHGNPVTLQSLVTSTTMNYFELAKQNDKGNSGNGGGDSGGQFSIKVPKNEEEFNKAFFEASTAEERTAIKEAYESAQN